MIQPVILGITQADAPRPPSQAQWLARTQQVIALQEQGRFQEALDICLPFTRAHPEIADAWIATAITCYKLRRWQDAIGYAQTALARGGNTFALYDTLACAYGVTGQWDEARRYGLRSLNLRAERFNGAPAPLPPPEPRPPPPAPSAQTRQHNLIAFSLFGGNPKYCETAVLNVQEQPQIYPDWICRFYVDASVPESVINRLRAGGAQIVPVQGASAQWSGQMWRFLAADDPQAHRVLFRDADSVISPREAGAVRQWIASGKRFHIMRDWYSHTELMLAGMWGVVGGCLPPLDQLMQGFISARPERALSAPLEFRRCADQYFLRQCVWPYARASLMQHDSVFGFMDAMPFPDGERPDGFHVGYIESAPRFTVKSDFPEGAEVIWDLCRIEKLDNGHLVNKLICSYPGVVKDGAVGAHIPARYVRWIEQDTVRVYIRDGRKF